ncbi:MAG: ATP-binding cassette domain-containing protein [Bdellovibrionota bacterium]
MTAVRTPIKQLRFDQVNFHHEAHESTLKSVEFDFPMNEVLWLKSDEGAGKSTVLQILAGLITPQSGGYFINEQNATEMSFEEFLPYRLNIGYSFDYGGLISNRTLYDNLMLPLIYHELLPHAEAKERVNILINQFELGKFKFERPAHVPGRVRKLVCVLRSVITYPDLLVMDDPSVGLGHDTSTIFLDYIHEIRRQGALKHIVLSSYDEKFMALLPHKELYLSEAGLYLSTEIQEKKVMNL